MADCAIRNIVELACTLLIHCAMHRLEEVQLDLWTFAMNYSVWLWNHLPNHDTGLSPNEVFNQTLRPNFKHLEQTHVWRCPTYFLKSVIQDGCKLPKWQPKSRRGIFLGFSYLHSSQIGLIKNIQTNTISLQ